MSEVDPRRLHADLDEPVVVFVVGMRFNKLWAVHRWLPVFRAGKRVRDEQGDADGCLGSRLLVGWRTLTFVQYWESTDALEQYAHDREREHHPAWMAFDRAVAETESVGIFHETTVSSPATTRLSTGTCRRTASAR